MSGPRTGTHYPEFAVQVGSSCQSGTAASFVVVPSWICSHQQKMSRVFSGSSGLVWVVQGPFSSAAVLSWVWWIQGVIPATLTAVGVVSPIVHGPFQVGDGVCRFQSFTHTKSPGEYGNSFLNIRGDIIDYLPQLFQLPPHLHPSFL